MVGTHFTKEYHCQTVNPWPVERCGTHCHTVWYIQRVNLASISTSLVELGRKIRFNPIWIGLFANLKCLGGHFAPLPFLFQLRRRWNMVRIYYGQRSLQIDKNVWWRHRHVDFMRSSKWDSWKNSRFSSVLAEYLKNGPTDFHQTYVILGNHIEGFCEMKRLKIHHSLLPW